MNRRRFVGALAARLNDQSVFGGSVEDAFPLPVSFNQGAALFGV
jgi:hypothetical protein